MRPRSSRDEGAPGEPGAPFPLVQPDGPAARYGGMTQYRILPALALALSLPVAALAQGTPPREAAGGVLASTGTSSGGGVQPANSGEGGAGTSTQPANSGEGGAGTATQPASTGESAGPGPGGATTPASTGTSSGAGPSR